MRLLLPLCLAAVAAGCSALTPFATSPSALEAGQVDPRARVSVCFNPLKTSAEDVQKLAQAQCLGDMVPEKIETDYRLDDCPALTPGRTTFACVARTPAKSVRAPTAK
jgi:hypothetical protein